MALPARHEGTRLPAAALSARTHAAAASDERAAFVEFLELPDPDIARYLLAGDVPADPRHAALCRVLAHELTSFPRASRPRSGSHGSRSVCAVTCVRGGVAVGLRARHLRGRRRCPESAASGRSCCSRARSAVRAIEWTEDGRVRRLAGIRALTATRPRLRPGSFRLGVRFWVLRFVTPAGPRPVLIAGGAQECRRFRRLSRCLTSASAPGFRALRAPRCYHPAQGLKCVTRH